MLLNLRALRIRKNLTQAEMAELMEMGRMQFYKLEQGELQVKKKHIDRFIELFPEEDFMKIFEDVNIENLKHKNMELKKRVRKWNYLKRE